MKLRHLFAAAMTVAALSLSAKAPKYIFFFIGDGMGPGQVMSAQTYNRLVKGPDVKLNMLSMPVASICTTYSSSSPVTDSAAAGTALATGSKTRNNMLGMNADTVAVRSVAEDLKDKGYGVALVTNVAPDDATPGAFYAHVPARGMFYEIGCQAAESGVDFLAGSILRGTKGRDGRPNDLMQRFADNGMAVVRGVKNLAGVESRRILLLNTDTVNANGGYTIDSIPGINTVAAMTDAAIAHMMKYSPKQWFMMVEGGNIDWAGHDNDGGTILKEVLAYDQALARALEFYKKHPNETLIVVTADHETGGMSVGQRSVGYNCYPAFVDYQRISKAQFGKECRALLDSGKSVTWDEMKEYLGDKLGFWKGVPVSEKQSAALEEKFVRTFVERSGEVNHTLYHDFSEFVEAVFDHMNRTAGFGFTTPNHSGNPVPVYAIGVGAEEFGRPLDNVDIPTIIRRLANIN
jgi:alkaline phosphatase